MTNLLVANGLKHRKLVLESNFLARCALGSFTFHDYRHCNPEDGFGWILNDREGASGFATKEEAITHAEAHVSQLLSEWLEIDGDRLLSECEAADWLNVSRQWIVRQYEEGAIPYRRRGTARFVALRDLVAFKAGWEEKAKAAAEELAALDQEMELG